MWARRRWRRAAYRLKRRLAIIQFIALNAASGIQQAILKRTRLLKQLPCQVHTTLLVVALRKDLQGDLAITVWPNLPAHTSMSHNTEFESHQWKKRTFESANSAKYTASLYMYFCWSRRARAHNSFTTSVAASIAMVRSPPNCNQSAPRQATMTRFS